MNTLTNLLILIAGIAIGYFINRKLNKSDNSEAVMVKYEIIYIIEKISSSLLSRIKERAIKKQT